MTLQAASARPFRFGVLYTGGGTAPRTWREAAQQAEDLGFSTLLVADHLDNDYTCTARLAATAMVTTTLRIGSYVYNNDLRHPAVLAREAADLDLLSDGRMELGLGAGWSKEEYDSVGIAFDEGRIRAERYEESVGILRRILAGDEVTSTGTHYTMDGFTAATLPVQQPLPLLLGGGGVRMTRFAARNADIVAFVAKSLPDGGLDPAEFARRAFDEKISVLDSAITDRQDGGPERSALLFKVGGSAMHLDTDEFADWSQVPDSPYVLIGSTQQMTETLLASRERWGLSYFVCWAEDIDYLAPVVARLAGG